MHPATIQSIVTSRLIKPELSPYVRYPLWGVELMFYLNFNWSFVAVLSRGHLTSP